MAALPARLAARAKHIALAVSVLTLALVVAMALKFDPNGAQFQFTEQHHWIEQFGVSYAVGVDGIALVLIALSAVLTPVCILAAWHDVDPRWVAASRTTSR